MSEVAASTRQGALRGFAAYLRRPVLTVPAGLRSAAAWRDLGILLVVQVGVLLAIILPLMIAWQNAFALGGPDAFEELPDGLFLPLTILIAPVLEELFFRGWLRGRKRALWLLLCAALVVGSGLTIRDEHVPPFAMAGVLGGLLAAPIGWFVLRKKVEPPRWFTAAFPAIFYVSLVGFALLHLSNYSTWSLVAVPLVLPQLWVGSMLGYIRMRIGLPASILAHILSNSAVVLITPLISSAFG